MTEQTISLGALSAIAVGDPAAELIVVILHGREMTAADLAPFARALGVPAYFVFPDGPLPSMEPHSPSGVLPLGGKPRPLIEPHSPSGVLPLGGKPRPSIEPHSPSGVLPVGGKPRPSIEPHSPSGVLPVGGKPRPSTRGRTWWPVDSEARIRALDTGSMDLSQMDPPGRAEARALLDGMLAALPDRRVVLAGFSQGGMLAMDYVLHGGRRPAALALFSSTRIAIADWLPRAPILAGLPVLVAHGQADAELAFVAGEQLRDFALAGGATVTWLPFDGGHEIPLVVWRALRKLLLALRA